MFTGLIEEVGIVLFSDYEPDDTNKRLEIKSSLAKEMAIGDSVAVNGVCLTVVEQNESRFAAQVSPTTLTLSNLGSLEQDQPVNLERSCTPATRLGGHWVQGHVDSTGTVRDITPDGEATHITVEFPASFRPLALPLGSITVNGVSLTIVDVIGDQIKITLIPHTWQHTTFQYVREGQRVNLEFDVVGKYVQQLLNPYLTGDSLEAKK